MALAAGKLILEQLLAHIGFEARVEVETGETSRLNVVGEEREREGLGALIGRKGEQVDKLSEEMKQLTKKAVQLNIEEIKRAGVLAGQGHTFTPTLGGEDRFWDLGVLWNRDPRIAVPLIEILRDRRMLSTRVGTTAVATGDLEVDLHHTVEDVGICLGKAFREALGDKKGITRYGDSYLPMDEALLHAAVDISGRPYLVWNVPLARMRIANFDLDLLKDFFRAFAFNAEITLHVTMHYGENLHHIAEAVFKAVGRALAEATRLNPRVVDVPSTKGSL